MDRPNKPSALATTPGLPPQPQVDISTDNARVSASLPTGEAVDVLLHGATVISWRDRAGNEKLWLSDAAKLDGSKAVRGGIPLVFPVFGTAPDHAPTSRLPQHGFARTSRWEFLGKSTSESSPSAGPSDASVKLDFGLSSATLGDDAKALWPHPFSLIYSVTLTQDGLATTIVVTNDGDQALECQVLLHTYLRVKDITQVSITGLEEAAYIDKVDGAQTKTQSGAVSITGETDRVYTPAGPPETPVVVRGAGGEEEFRVVRDGLRDVVVWNPWSDKAAAMADFELKDAWNHMLCVEAGAVRDWTRLEPGETFEGRQTISY